MKSGKCFANGVGMKTEMQLKALRLVIGFLSDPGEPTVVLDTDVPIILGARSVLSAAIGMRITQGEVLLYLIRLARARDIQVR